MPSSNSVSTIFRCMSCSFGTRDQSTYAEHIKHCSNKSACEKLQVASDGEEVQNNSSETVKSHQTSHICTECNLPTGSKRALLLHLRDVHDKDIRIFVCKFCSQCASQHISVVRRHARSKHAERALRNTRVHAELHKENVIQKSPANSEASADVHCISTVETTPCDQNEGEISDSVISSRSLGLHFLGKQLCDTGCDEFVCLLCSFSAVVSHIVVKHIWKDHKDKLSEVTAEAAATEAAEDANMTTMLYKCGDCSYSTREKFSFYNHCSHHQFKGPSKCPHCSFCALTDGAISQHLRICHSGQHLNLSADSLKSIHTKISAPCKVIKTSGNSPCNKKVCAQQQGQKKWLECPHCPFKSKWSSSLHKHKKTYHQKIRKECRTTFASNSLYPSADLKKTGIYNTVETNANRHKAERRKPSNDQLFDATSTAVKESVYKCDKCSANFKSLHCLQSHEQMHLDLRRYQCPLCGLRGNYWSNASTHISTVHKSKSTKPIKLSLEDAKRTVEAYKKQFVSEKSKKRAAYDTVKVNPSCQKTKQQNPSSDHLYAKSVPSHLKESVYKCDICSAKFQSVKYYKIHKTKVHLQFAGYQCPICGVRTNYVRNMKKHIHSVHKDTLANSSDNSLMRITSKQPRLDNADTAHSDLDPGIPVLKKRYSCSVCRKQSYHVSSIYRHIRNISHGRKATVIVKKVKIPLNKAGVALKRKTAGSVRPKSETSSNSRTLYKQNSWRKSQQSVDNAEHDDSSGAKFHLQNTAKSDVHNVPGNEDTINLVQPVTELNKNAPVQPSPVKHEVSKPYLCDICPFRTAKLKDLSSHHRLHVKRSDNSFACNISPYFTSQERHLKRHKKLHFEQSTDVEKKVEPNLEVCHRKSEHKATGHFLCDHCPFIAHQKSRLIHHKLLHRPRVSGLFKCEQCDFWVTGPRNLRNHAVVHTVEYMQKRLKHGQLPHVSASLGNDVTETASEMHKVIASHQSAPDDDNELPVKNVATADKGKLDEMNQNMSMNDSSESTVNNEQVADITEESVDISAHSRSSTVNRQLPSWCCERCPYSSSRLACFKRHVWLHGKHYPYECGYCDYSVESYWQLVSHVLWHFAPNKHLVYAQPVSYLDSFASRLPNRDSVPDSVASIDSFVPSFENSDVFLLSDVSNFQCQCCPFVTEQRSEFFSHMLCHCVRNAAVSKNLICPFCSFHTDMQERLSAHVFLHFNLPGCRQSSLPPNTCHSDDWKRLDAAIEALLEKNADHSEPCTVQSHDSSNLVECASSLNAGSQTTKNQTAIPCDCEDDLSTEKPVRMQTVVHSEDDNVHTLLSMPQPALSDMHTDESVGSSDRQRANVIRSTDFMYTSLMEETSSATQNKTECCRYCDTVIDDPAALAQHQARHLIGYCQLLPSLGEILLYA